METRKKVKTGQLGGQCPGWQAWGTVALSWEWTLSESLWKANRQQPTKTPLWSCNSPSRNLPPEDVTRRRIKVLFIIINSGNNLNAISAIFVYKKCPWYVQIKKSDYEKKSQIIGARTMSNALFILKMNVWGTFQVVQWLRICQCKGHKFDPWSRKMPPAMGQRIPGSRTREPQLLKPAYALRPVVFNRRSHCKEKPVHHI